MELIILCWIFGIYASSSGWMNNFSPSEVQLCSNSSDCDRSSGLICFQMYEGCPLKGQCMCDLPSRLQQTDDISGRCVPVRLGLESCSSDVTCREGMTCKNALCRCRSGRMTSDRLHCLRHSDRLIGEKCSANENTCYQRSAAGYTTGDVTCSSSAVCACSEGYKAVGLSCKRRKVYEYGCKKSYHCEGGAICSDSRCVCPTGYATTQGSFKCIRIGATTNVPLGGECDEVNDRVYCATDLVCHRCASTANVYHCVKFLLADDYSLPNSAGISVQTSSSSNLCICIFAILTHRLYSVVR